MEALWPVLRRRADSFITVISSGLRIDESLSCSGFCEAEAAAEREVSGHIPVEDNLASQDDGKSMRTAEVKNSAFDDVVDMLQFKPTPLSVSTFETTGEIPDEY